MHESNKLCMLQTGRKKPLEVLKRKENNFINAIGDKFAMILKLIWLYKPFSVN